MNGVALGSARLLGGQREVQRFHDLSALTAMAAQVRLLGRGGAAFPVAAKLGAMSAGASTQVLVNGSESEPASRKDRLLMRTAPHLVLDGAQTVARSLGTAHVTVVVDDALAWSSLTAAARERHDGAGIRVVMGPGTFVSGEVRAAVRAVDGGPAVPPGRRVLPHEHGVQGAPTFASNVETFAQLAMLASLGPDRFASVGSPAEPGTTLVTLVGDVPRPGVVEVPTGLPLAALLPGQTTDPRPVLVGGYHGTWVADVGDLELTRPALRTAGSPLNAGVVARLSHATCALAEVVAVTSWLARQSSGQCGPCFFGLPTVARDLHRLLRGEDARPELARRVGLLPGRGACAHPDGTATFVRTALATMTTEVDAHLRHGSCGRPWLDELGTR